MNEWNFVHILYGLGSSRHRDTCEFRAVVNFDATNLMLPSMLPRKDRVLSNGQLLALIACTYEQHPAVLALTSIVVTSVVAHRDYRFGKRVQCPGARSWRLPAPMGETCVLSCVVPHYFSRFQPISCVVIMYVLRVSWLSYRAT
jgi:hypothetical protein